MAGAAVLGVIGEDPGTSRYRVLAVAGAAVQAGFPSPAQDYEIEPIDLLARLVADRAATFIVRVAGSSMTGVGIFDGDELLVDRSLDPVDGDVVVAVIDGELTVKTLHHTPRGPLLRAENPAFPDVVVRAASENLIWGVAYGSLRHLHSWRRVVSSA